MEHDQIRSRDAGGYLVLELKGQFVGGEETDALQIMFTEISEQEVTVLVDMSEVSFANSSFLSALLSAHARITRRGGQMVIMGMSETIAHVFTITKLDRIFNVFDTADDAVAFIKTSE